MCEVENILFPDDYENISTAMCSEPTRSIEETFLNDFRYPIQKG